MTGIERLHKLIADIDVSADPKLWDILRWGTEGDWDCEERDDKTLCSTLAAIADQIEREQGGRVSRMRVLAVVTDMERHVSGVEGADDSPVASWARELREALGGNGLDPAADVSVSAYDLPPADERNALAWVRKHGGLDAVERRWECLSYYADPVPRSCMEKRLARLQRQIDECHEALRRRNQRIEELDQRVGDLTTENAELRARLMPEGYEWPRYESDELVMLGDTVTKYVGGGTIKVRSVEFLENMTYLHERFKTDQTAIVRHGERVRRPVPKVYDADGVEIREGDRVWSTHLDEPHEWIVIDPHEDRDDSQTVLVSIGDRTGHARPEDLTHRALVLASDGEPLEVGQTVWETDAEADTPLTVVEVSSDLVRCEYTWKDGKTYRPCYQPDQLTHQRPDSWERVEEDADKATCEYFDHPAGACLTCPARDTIPCLKAKSRDLVRRCRALAERERGK